MPMFAAGRHLEGGVLAGVVWAALTTLAASQQNAHIPDFSSNQVGWIATNPDFVAVPGGPSPTRSDPAHNNSGAQPAFRVADLSNPNLKPWAREVMRKEN